MNLDDKLAEVYDIPFPAVRILNLDLIKPFIPTF
jgi:hypothetical protein